MKNLIYKISAVVMLLVFVGTTNLKAADYQLCPGTNIIFYSDDPNNPADVGSIVHILPGVATYAWSMVYPNATDASGLITDLVDSDGTPDIIGNNIVSLEFPIGTETGVYILTVVKTDVGGNGCNGDPITYTIEVLDVSATVDVTSDEDNTTALVDDQFWCPGDLPYDYTFTLSVNTGTLDNFDQVSYTTDGPSLANAILASGDMALAGGVGTLNVAPAYTSVAVNGDFPTDGASDAFAITITGIQFDVTTTEGTFNNVTCTQESIENMLGITAGVAPFNATFYNTVDAITIDHL